MKDLDIMRGYDIPRSEINFRRVDDTSIISTDRMEAGMFPKSIPDSMRLTHGVVLTSETTPPREL